MRVVTPATSALILANPRAAVDGFDWEGAYLKGVVHDFKVLKAFFNDFGIPLSVESCCDPDVCKQDVCNRLHGFFQEPVETYILVVASHGAPVGGEICSFREGWLRFEEVLRLWVALGHACDASKVLLMVVDFCHSGFWVNKAAKLRCANVVVQASCLDSSQSVGDYEEDCGPDTSFLCKYLDCSFWLCPVSIVYSWNPYTYIRIKIQYSARSWHIFSFFLSLFTIIHIESVS